MKIKLSYLYHPLAIFIYLALWGLHVTNGVKDFVFGMTLIYGIYFYIYCWLKKKGDQIEKEALEKYQSDPAIHIPKILKSVQVTLSETSYFQHLDIHFHPLYNESLELWLSEAQKALHSQDFSFACDLIRTALHETHLIIFLDQQGYIKPLCLKFSQLVYKDEYGDYSYESAKQEIAKFCKSRFEVITKHTNQSIESRFSQQLECLKKLLFKKHGSTYKYIEYEENSLLFGSHPSQKNLEELTERIQSILTTYYFSEEGQPTFIGAFEEVTDGIAYEKFVSEELRTFGWTTQTTKTSGDQGADIIAQKMGLTLIIQCKYYSSAVGNKAVQEAHAAKGFYQADHCAVVVNSSYTKSAKQLAQSIGVTLLHHAEISDLDSILFPT